MCGRGVGVSVGRLGWGFTVVPTRAGGRECAGGEGAGAATGGEGDTCDDATGAVGEGAGDTCDDATGAAANGEATGAAAGGELIDGCGNAVDLGAGWVPSERPVTTATATSATATIPVATTIHRRRGERAASVAAVIAGDTAAMLG